MITNCHTVLLDTSAKKDVIFGYIRSENGIVYGIRTTVENVPNWNRPTIECREFARYFCFEATADHVPWGCNVECGDVIKCKFFYGNAIAAQTSGRQKEGLYGYDIDGNFILNFDENGKKHGPCADLCGTKSEPLTKTEYYNHGIVHRTAPAGERDDEYFAVIYSNGRKEWRQNGLLHRDNDKPAVIRENGQQEWWVNGKLHRDNDLPAVVSVSDGQEEWWQNGVRSRHNDLPAIVNKRELRIDLLEPRLMKQEMETLFPEENIDQVWSQKNDINPSDLTDVPLWVLRLCSEKPFSIWFVDGKVGRLNDRPAVVAGILHAEKEPDEFTCAGNVCVRREKVKKTYCQAWAMDGKPFRENDTLPTCVEENVSQTWLKDGKMHRIGAPAYIKFDPYEEHWYQNGKMHRDDDLPAFVAKHGKEWYQNGLHHRENDQPAVESNNMGNIWYLNGEKHRENDLPAIESERFSAWCKHDVLHRDDDKAAIVYKNGQKEWWKNGLRHRDNDLPAVIAPNGHEEYWVNGKLHRKGNPAIIVPDAKSIFHSLYFVDNKQDYQETLRDSFPDRNFPAGTREIWEHGKLVETQQNNLLDE